MFSLLNTQFGTGNHRARMCKFLNSLPQFSRSLWRRVFKASYLVEDLRFRSMHLCALGHRIASLVP